MTRRVFITGMGAVSAAGDGVEALWQAARDGRSGIRELSLDRGEGLRIRQAARVPDFNPEGRIDPVLLRTSDLYTQFGICAAVEAVKAAGLDRATFGGDRTAAIIGSGVGGIGTLDEGCFHFYRGERIDLFSVPRVMTSSVASHVSIVLGVTGPTFVVSGACASGSQAIGIAASLIRAGVIDRAICGGAETCINPSTMRAWEMLRVLTPGACRPFSAGRDGMVLGEGAGMMVLEAEDAAVARSATPLAILAGYGTSSDAKDMLQPDAEGAAKAITAALSDAGLSPADIDYINAHGTGTVLNDITEAAALRAVFGDKLDAIPVSSSKPIIGHALGAGGALELIITVRALMEQIVPPHLNLTAPDPKCPLNLATGDAVPAPISAAISNSFAFGGINASLIVSRAR